GGRARGARRQHLPLHGLPGDRRRCAQGGRSVSLIGQSVRRGDGEAKVRGEAVYTLDYAEAGMLQAKLLRSPVPAGRIVRLETGAAEQMPGVRAVATAADAPARGGWLVEDQTMFADGVVRFAG